MKTIRPSLAIALRALQRNKLQTGLTMVGITIGVATVLTMIALGSGAQSAIVDQVRAAGMNTIIVTAGNYKTKTKDADEAVEEQARLWPPSEFAPAVRASDNAPPTRSVTVAPQLTALNAELRRDGYGARTSSVIFRPVFHPEDDPMEKHDHPTASQRLGDMEAGLGAAATLTSADADAIRKIKGVQYVSEGVHNNVHVVFGSKRWFTRMHGDDVSLPMIRRAWLFEQGRFFSKREQSNAAQVIVLGSVVNQRLFGSENPVGKKVSIYKQPFEVVGVVGSGSWLVAAAPGDDQFDAVYVPFTTIHKLLNLSKLNDITVTTASSGDVTHVVQQITDLLRARHNISEKKPDDFTVTSQARQALAQGGMLPEVARSVVGNVAGLEKVTLEQLGKTLDRASRTMTALLASVAAVSLLVGGIGIMNIMLLSVTERTREIGIRRAVGAKAGDVLRQFLMEAVTLSVAGGLAGIMIGAAASATIAQWARWSVSISGAAVVVSFGIAAMVGIFFGYYPARQASRVAPIDALRYE